MQTIATRLPTETRQAEIVASALRLAQDCSPSAITTTDMARAMGLSQGALFKHFSSKEAIWLAAMSWVAEHLLCTLNAAAQQAPTPVEAMQRVFDAHVEFVISHPGVPRMIFHELQQPEDSPLKQQVRLLMQGYRQLLLGLLNAAAQRGDLVPELDAPAAATLFLGIVQGLVMQSMMSGQMQTMKAEGSRVFQLYLRAICKNHEA